jgi:hypothetical protein
MQPPGAPTLHPSPAGDPPATAIVALQQSLAQLDRRYFYGMISTKRGKDGSLDGLTNLLGALGFTSRLDSQTKMYMLVLHVLILVYRFNYH